MTEEEQNQMPSEPVPPLMKAYIDRDIHPDTGFEVKAGHHGAKHYSDTHLPKSEGIGDEEEHPSYWWCT